MGRITARVATLEDTSKIAVLFDAYRQFYEQAPDAKLATRYISDRLKNNESIIFIAEDETNNAVGFCQVYPTFCSVIAAPIYALYDLYVTPATRKAGAGKLLLEKAHQHAQENHIARMDLTTAKNNLIAQSLYESLGWEKDTVFYAYNKTV